MTIRDRGQVPVVVLRVASPRDVVRLGAPMPDDARVVEAGDYVVVRDDGADPSGPLTGERICRRLDLTGSGGSAEVDEAVELVAAAARGHVVRFRVEETPACPPLSASCVQVEYNPYEDEVDLTHLERYDPGEEWAWVRDASPCIRWSTLEQIVATVRRIRDAREAAAQDAKERIR